MKHVLALTLAALSYAFVPGVQAGLYDTMAQREEGLAKLALLEVGRDNDQALIDVDKHWRRMAKEIRAEVKQGIAANRSCLVIKKRWRDEEDRLYNNEPDIKAIFDEADHDKVMSHVANYVLYDCLRVKAK